MAETTTICSPSSRSRSSCATWRMRPASASEEPPNLCAMDEVAIDAVATDDFALVGESGLATALMEPPGGGLVPLSGWIAWAPASVFSAGPWFAGIYLRTTDRTTVVVVVVVA